MGISPAARLGMVRKGEMMSKYKIEMIIEVEGHPRKWLAESIAEQLHQGEDILEYSIKEIENE